MYEQERNRRVVRCDDTGIVLAWCSYDARHHGLGSIPSQKFCIVCSCIFDVVYYNNAKP